MRAVVQRVMEASVEVDKKERAQIGQGLLVFLGIEAGDSEQDAIYLSEKIAGLRIFEDAEEKMNLSVQDVGGSVLTVSQFTLLGDCRKGKRPSFKMALAPTEAEKLYHFFCGQISQMGIVHEQGVFGADMKIKLTNDGPVTILLDSQKKF